MRAGAVKAFRYNAKSLVAMALITVVGTAVGGYILAHQRLDPPAWVPIVGEEHFVMRVELQTAAGVMPGQGQSVNVSGIKIGDIASVDLEDGKAVATVKIQPRFARVYPDATALLRPKTNLKDMVLELDPGTPASGPPLKENAKLTTASTQPDVNFEEFIASLDSDTRSYLKLLVTDGGRALGTGGGRDLAQTFRRFDPLARDFAKASKLVARRRHRLRRVMTNFSLLATELGKHDDELARFVRGSAGVFRRFANQNENLASTFRLLPGALRSTNRGFVKLDRLGKSLDTTLGALAPTAKALGPTLRDLQPFLRSTTPALRDELRPFARDARPTARALVPAARELAQATPDLHKLTDVLNALFDEMAYDPPGKGVGKEPYLFYVPWATHNTNSALSSQDGIGPVRRGMVLVDCGSLLLLESEALQRNPTLQTSIQLLNAPKREQVCKRAGGRP